MVTLGTPHMGVSQVPVCFYGFICDMVNEFVKTFVYYDIVQQWVGPAGYFRDPAQLSTYKSHSVFLPYVNNEKKSDISETNIRRFKELKKAMLI